MSPTPTPTTWIIGSAGQLGSALRASAHAPSEIRSLTSADIDLTDPTSVQSALAGLRPDDIVLNTAAYTDVDGAESDADRAAAVNAGGPEALARATAAAGAWLVHVSTDYVFGAAAGRAGDGAPVRSTPYEPADVGRHNPETVYGATKLDGERRALAADPRTTVVRTAWVYTGRSGDRDFVGTMRRLEDERDEITVVDDQTGSPTYSRDLADGLWELVARGPRPEVTGVVLHATNGGQATWFDVARAVFADIGADPERVRPCGTDQFPRPAPRPAYSVLSPASWTAAGLRPLRDWRTALHAAVTADGPGAPITPAE